MLFFRRCLPSFSFFKNAVGVHDGSSNTLKLITGQLLERGPLSYSCETQSAFLKSNNGFSVNN